MSWLSPLLAVLLTMLCGALLFALLGKNPLAGLSVFFWEPIRNVRGWTEIGVKVHAADPVRDRLCDLLSARR